MAKSFEIKSSQLPLVALLLKSAELNQVSQDLLKEFGPDSENPEFFEHEPLVIDFSLIRESDTQFDLAELLSVLQCCSLKALAFCNASVTQRAAALALGLTEAPAAKPLTRSARAVEREVVREVVREAPSTMLIDKPLRSGQKVYARGADLVLLSMVNQGAEVVADGNIHVYAPLRGKAMAGASGNTKARIFSICLEPELISIAGIYRTSETPLALGIQGKAAQVRLSGDGQDKLIFEALKA